MRLAEQPAVGLELGLARPAQADAALLSLEVGPAAHQARRQVLELGQFDLQLALEGARAQREDIQDQAGAVDDPALQRPLEIALLRRAQVVVDQHQAGVRLIGARRSSSSLPEPSR